MQLQLNRNIWISAKRHVSIFAKTPMAPPDPILSLTTEFQVDKHPHKINLGVGAYRDGHGKPWILPSVRSAIELLHEEVLATADGSKEGINFEYVPILGTNSYRSTVKNFLFCQKGMDSSSKLVNDGRVLTMQGLSGTGSLRVIGEFLSNFHPNASQLTIATPRPTWGNHVKILEKSGKGINVSGYTYYDPKTKGLNLKGMLEDLNKLNEGDAVLLHVCCHNPTGVDPTIDEWNKIVQVITQKKLIPILDMAYQGFGNGIVEDLKVIELFSKQVTNGEISNFFLSQSWAKNMGLYGERVGSFSVICGDKIEAEKIESQFKLIARPMYSSPPGNGARVVELILNTPELYEQWGKDVDVMALRLKDMRALLFDKLNSENVRGPGNGATGWEHLIEQNGMFCFTGLNETQVDKLLEKSIYLTKNGRISMAGVNKYNVEYLVQCIKEVIQE